MEAGWFSFWEIGKNIQESTIDKNGNLIFSNATTYYIDRAHGVFMRPLLVFSPRYSKLRYYGLSGLEGLLPIAFHSEKFGLNESWVLGDKNTPFPGIRFSLKLGGGIDYQFGRFRLGVQSDLAIVLFRLFRPESPEETNRLTKRKDGLPSALPSNHELPPTLTFRINMGVPDLFKSKDVK